MQFAGSKYEKVIGDLLAGKHIYWDDIEMQNLPSLRSALARMKKSWVFPIAEDLGICTFTDRNIPNLTKLYLAPTKKKSKSKTYSLRNPLDA